MTKRQEKRRVIEDRVAAVEKRYGKGAGSSGSLQRALNTIPTGSLALDFELGTGGWPRGYLSGVFGPRDIGKNSLVLHGIAEAQKMGLNATLIAYEAPTEGLQTTYKDWIALHGVDPEELLIVYPTTGEEAFGMLYDSVTSGEDDFVVFDSIGAILGEGEAAEDGKMRQGGQAGLITWGLKRAAPWAYRNNVAVLLLNQIRADMSSRFAGAVSQPGGYALEHLEAIIVQLKRTKEKFTLKDAGTDVVIGHQIAAQILRNKLSQGTNRKAIFDMYFADTGGEYPFGIDTFTDTINTGKRTGTIVQAGAIYTLPDGSKHKGGAKVEEYLAEHPAVLDAIRDEVLKTMMAGNKKTALEVVNGDG